LADDRRVLKVNFLMTESFDANDRAAIHAALADPDPENEIAKAIAVRIVAHTELMLDQVTKMGAWPDSIEFAKPANAFDEAVITLFQALVHGQHAVIADMLGKDLSDMPPVPKIFILDHGSQ
jgi:hypothetical protein